MTPNERRWKFKEDMYQKSSENRGKRIKALEAYIAELEKELRILDRDKFPREERLS